MQSQGKLKLITSLLLLVAAAVFAASCGGSKANVRKQETAANAEPAVVEVTTAAATSNRVNATSFNFFCESISLLTRRLLQ